MRLSAHQVSLYLPAIAAGGAGTTGSGSVGGTFMLRGGKPVIRALHDVSLDVAAGSRLGVLGHNGAGKTTLLKTLAGLYTPQEGHVEADGEVSGIFNMTVGFRREATGYRNIVLKGLMAGWSRREIDAVIPEIEAFTELGPYLHAPMHTYSQGMALRLAFATTTAFSHEILVMDEWIGAGDARFQDRVVGRMDSLMESAAICVLASHNAALLRRVTDQCLWLEHGEVRALGDTEDVLAEYEAAMGVVRRQRPAPALETPDVAEPPSPDGQQVARLDAILLEDGGYELAWEVATFQAGRVQLVVVERDGSERAVCKGPPCGSRRPGDWVRPGQEFRLVDLRDGSQLASTTIPPAG